MLLINVANPGWPGDCQASKQQVKINQVHPIIVSIYNICKLVPTLAIVLTEQVFDNCLLAAGEMGHLMLARLNDLMTAIMEDAGSDVHPELTESNDSDSSEDESSSSNNEVSSEDKKEEEKGMTMAKS